MLSPARVGALLTEGTQRWAVGAASIDKPDLADASLACQGMPRDAWVIFRWVYCHGDTAEDWRSRDARQAAGILALYCVNITKNDKRLTYKKALRFIVCALRDLRGGDGLLEFFSLILRRLSASVTAPFRPRIFGREHCTAAGAGHGSGWAHGLE